MLGIDVATDALIERMLTPLLSRSEAERLLREPTATSAPAAGRAATDELAARVIGTAVALAISGSRWGQTPRRSRRSSPAL